MRRLSAWIGRFPGRAFRVAYGAIVGFFGARCLQGAAALGYSMLFSIFPFMLVLIAVFGLVMQDDEARTRVTEAIVNALPLSQQGEDEISRLVENTATPLSAIGLVGIAGLVFAAIGMITVLRSQLNTAFGIDAGRPFLRGKLFDLALLAGVGALVLVSVGLTVTTRVVRQLSDDASASLGALGSATSMATVFGGIVAPVLLTFVAFLVVYRVVPATRVRVLSLVPGAVVATIAFEALKYVLAAYLANFDHYQNVYGSLGAAIGLMFAVYATGAILLFGGHVAAQWAREKAIDDSGAEREQGPPLGEQLRDFARGLWYET